MTDRPFIPQWVLILFLFALGAAIAIFGSYPLENVDFGRARLTIWTCFVLGGSATALAIVEAPDLPGTTAWRLWWFAGLLAYIAHIWFGFGVMFGWSFAAVFASQGFLVAGANFLLLVVWTASAILALFRSGTRWLHLASTALFIVTTLSSTLIRPGEPAFFGGILIGAVWIGAFVYRFARRHEPAPAPGA